MLIRAGPNHPIFNTYPNQKEDILKLYGFKDEKSMNDALDILEAWVQQQNHFVDKNISREYLEAYLITGKGSMEKAKKKLDKRCTLKSLMPELFNNIQVNTDFKNLIKCYKHVLMPTPTKDFYRVNIEVYYGETKKFNFIDYARYMIVNAEYNIVNEYIVGFEVILDFSLVSFSEILSKMNPIVLQKLMTALIEGYGCRIKAIHIVYDSKFIETLINLLKQSMSEKIGKRIQTHANYETLHKFIEKECLPIDYGGTGPSIQEVHEKVYKEMTSENTQQILKNTDRYCTDESKRMTGKFNQDYLGMPGSFRTLNVD